MLFGRLVGVVGLGGSYWLVGWMLPVCFCNSSTLDALKRSADYSIAINNGRSFNCFCASLPTYGICPVHSSSSLVAAWSESRGQNHNQRNFVMKPSVVCTVVWAVTRLVANGHMGNHSLLALCHRSRNSFVFIKHTRCKVSVPDLQNDQTWRLGCISGETLEAELRLLLCFYNFIKYA